MGKKSGGSSVKNKSGNGVNRKKIKLFKNKNSISKLEVQEINNVQEKYKTIDASKVSSFKDFPLSGRTQKGLKECGYTVPTEIQREAIGLALQGKDILGAAKTGSGKTLAFLIPVLECLFCQQWTHLDGLGALVITPTRELALQIFETLRNVGRYHDFSAGLIIGGKDLHFEKSRMEQVNVIIGTPGRLLHHMDENPLFSCHNLQILVLDEADRCLDLGFEHTMNSIIENLPPKRQTLLFSATQTKSVRDLARLSLKDACYVSVVEKARHSTPDQLRQSYTVVELQDKMAVLWSFVRSHLKHKVLVFLASCKQVKYHYEVLCRLRPGVSVLSLYGSLHQLRRMDIYRTFCSKKHAVLLATDLAARGLDFPEVDWVLQLDCPEDAHTYIHRAGRTARYQAGGESVLVLLPSEEPVMLQRLEDARIPPLQHIRINPNKLQNPQRKLEALLARDKLLKESAQRAFLAYLKSVFLMSDKQIFNIQALKTDSYARSLGLAIPPRVRFLQRHEKMQQQKQEAALAQKLSKLEKERRDENSGDDDDDDGSDHYNHLEEKDDGEQYLELGGISDDSDSDEGILKLRRRDHTLEDEIPDEPSEMTKIKSKPLTKVAVAKKILKKKIAPNKKTVFDEEGQALVDATREKITDAARQYEAEGEGGGINLEQAREILRLEDSADKQRFRERIRAKHREEKLKLKKARMKQEEELKTEEAEVTLAGSDNESSEEDSPDLSWLPDPDKVFGSVDKRGQELHMESNSDGKSSDSAHSDDEHSYSSDNSELETYHKPLERPVLLKTKRKHPLEKTHGGTKKARAVKDVLENLEDTELLALRFLRR